MPNRFLAFSSLVLSSISFDTPGPEGAGILPRHISMRNNHIALPLSPTNSTAVHCAMPIAPTLSAPKSIESTCFVFDSLASKSLLTEARSRVFKNTNLTISVKCLLTTASNCWESHPKLKV